jgi:hypothetical protein
MTKHKHSLTAVQNPSFDLCAGATASAGSTTLTFTNHRSHSCTITGLGNLVDCGNSFVVDAKSSKTCNILSNAAAGTYPYSSPCCDGPDTNPVIIMQ